jgi:hypothetical protein
MTKTNGRFFSALSSFTLQFYSLVLVSKIFTKIIKVSKKQWNNFENVKVTEQSKVGLSKDLTLLRNLTLLYSAHGLIDLIIDYFPEQSRVE